VIFAISAVRGQDQRQRAGGGRAVLGGHPLRQAHQLGGNPQLERLQRGRQALGRDGRLARQVDHHAQHAAVAERHDQQRTDAHSVEGLGHQVIERTTQASSGGERLDPGYREHAVESTVTAG
jgi:hypothetical protein